MEKGRRAAKSAGKRMQTFGSLADSRHNDPEAPTHREQGNQTNPSKPVYEKFPLGSTTELFILHAFKARGASRPKPELRPQIPKHPKVFGALGQGVP